MKQKKPKPMIKNFYRKTIKAARNTAILALVAGSFFTTANVVREFDESRNGENQIIEADFGFIGSYVLYNRDNRTALQIYDDAINTALNVEGLEDAYKNSKDMTIEQKKAFLTRFAKEVAESGGLRVKEVVFLEKEEMGPAQGIYKGFNKGILHYSQNKIFISNEMLITGSLDKAIETTFHEVIHGIEGINIQTNKNVINLNPRVHNGDFTYGEKVYYSNFHEISAHLIANKFGIKMQEKFGDTNLNYAYYATFSNMNDLLNEIVDNDMDYKNRDYDYYNNLTVRDVISIGFKNNYENKKVEFNLDILEDSYSYEVINYTVPEDVLKMNFADYKNGYGQYKSWNLSEEQNKLGDYLESFKAGNYYELMTQGFDDYGLTEEECIAHAEQTLARQMAKLISIIRYDKESYSKEDLQAAYSLIINNLDLVKEGSIEYYRLDKTDNIEVFNKSDSKTSKIKLFKNINLDSDKELEL